MADVEFDVRQANLPNGQSICDLIIGNNLDRIRSLLNPLTLRNRQLIVRQKVYNKTLIGHACELGFRNIVKYLLDECEADISERYPHCNTLLSPLRVSVNNLDVLMLVLLVKRGAFDADAPEVISCAAHALKRQYFFIFSILSDYNDAIESLDDCPGVLDILSWLNYMNLKDASRFLRASACGNIGRMKTSLTYCVDPKVTDYFEENALCMTIMNKKSNAEHFLLNYRVFSRKEHVRALELCGAKFVAFKSDIRSGKRCWRKSLRIRNEHFLGVSDKHENKPKTGLGVEFTCEEEIEKLTSQEAEFYQQALVVLLRLLPPSSQLLQDAFVAVAKHPVFHKDLLQAIKILAELAELPYFPENVLCSPMYTATVTLEPLFLCHFFCDRSYMNDILFKLRTQIDFMIGVEWKVILAHQGEFYPVVYIQLLKNLLRNIIAISKFKQGIDDNIWIKEGISTILKWHPDPYPTTLLHLAIEEPTASLTIPYILECSDDVNSRDKNTNTPMHIVSFLQADDDHLLRLVDLLADAGGHIDAVNKYGITPLMTLKFRDVFKNPLNFLSLKCLAASKIPENIGILEKYPPKIVSFIKIHRKCIFPIGEKFK